VLQNLLDSHDTDRVASMAHNPDRPFDGANRVQDNGPNYRQSKPDARGVSEGPSGRAAPDDLRRRAPALLRRRGRMWGADDPTCRKPMLWEDLQPYDEPGENCVMPEQARVLQSRQSPCGNAHPALRTGTFQTLLTDDAADVWAFLRRDADEQLLVVLNASTAARRVAIPLPLAAPHRWRAIFGDNALAAASTTRLAPTSATYQATGGGGQTPRLDVTIPPVAGLVLHAAAK